MSGPKHSELLFSPWKKTILGARSELYEFVIQFFYVELIDEDSLFERIIYSTISKVFPLSFERNFIFSSDCQGEGFPLS